MRLILGFVTNGTPTQPPTRRYTINGRDHHSRRLVRHRRLSLRRYEAAKWLRRMVGLVVAKDLPAEQLEREFRLGLRSGLMLCNVLNKAQPGAVPKVFESSADSTLLPAEAALSAYQYFESVRNFLVALEGMELSALRRYEAARWLRKMVRVVAAKDLPAEPSEEEFRLGLRSGLMLCNVLNMAQPHAVPKTSLEHRRLTVGKIQ